MYVHRQLRKQRERTIVSEFAELIAVPHSMTTPLVMPTASKLFVKLGVTVAVNTVICTVAGVSKYIKPTTAGIYRSLGYFEAKETLTAVYAGSMDFYIQDSVGKLHRIATKV